MQAMGVLQPSLSNPAMIPESWHLLIVDLKDCFFTIKLHPADSERFTFTIPSTNREAPAAWYEWTVLPQGMKNSPTLCQLFVDTALELIRWAGSQAIIYHYMDNILIAQSTPFSDIQEQFLAEQLKKQGLMIAPEKVQW